MLEPEYIDKQVAINAIKKRKEKLKVILFPPVKLGKENK